MSIKEILRMVLVLTLVTGIWGGLLSLVKMATQDQIEYQRIKNVKAPALEKALTVEYTNDPVKERKKIRVGTDEAGNPIIRNVFIAKQNGRVVAVALEGYGSGYGGDMGVMVAIKPESNKVDGIAVTTHAETPGVGTKAMKSEAFMGQFSGKNISASFAPGGGIDAHSGATYTSEGIMQGVERATKIFSRNREKIL
ncbi:MAG: FMN-binding protein [Desulfohalobiaceae bacterium]|nr:FMN-binding protein [Desulfohalobiaceae bacterium]